MIKTNLPTSVVSGVKIRTSNKLEMSPETGKIGGLWQHFGEVVQPRLQEGSKVYGVYTHYESDVNGEFDVYAGADSVTDTDALETVELAAGKYKVFSGEGQMPQIVIDLWGQVWTYFAAEGAEERAYTTDYEWYETYGKVHVYIAIK